MKLPQDFELDEFNEFVAQLYDEFDQDFHNAILDFSCHVYNELGDSCYLSKMYHILIGSTPDLTAVGMDLKGELSTQQFVRDFQHRWQAITNYISSPTSPAGPFIMPLGASAAVVDHSSYYALLALRPTFPPSYFPTSCTLFNLRVSLFNFMVNRIARFQAH
jgi:hypothetical protein